MLIRPRVGLYIQLELVSRACLVSTVHLNVYSMSKLQIFHLVVQLILVRIVEDIPRKIKLFLTMRAHSGLDVPNKKVLST